VETVAVHVGSIPTRGTIMDRFIRCQAKTKSGEQCKTGAMSLTPFCGMHQGSEHPHVKKLEKEKTRNKDL
jgi:hypothetical protein